VDHRLGIVSIHSYTAILKPSRGAVSVRRYPVRTEKLTIDFFVIMKVSERIEVHITMERHMRPIDASGVSNPGVLTTYSTRQ